MQSLLKTQPGFISFPENKGERFHQIPFKKDQMLPSHLKRWQTTVDEMLVGIDCDDVMYLMIDQKMVREGDPHRRPGIHIDGHWNAERGMHTPPRPPGHYLSASSCWDVPDPEDRWNSKDVDCMKGGLILASDVCGSQAFLGDFEGEIKEGGDCSLIEVSKCKVVPLAAYKAHVCNVTCLHESTPVPRDTRRTVVRITLPEDFDYDKVG